MLLVGISQVPARRLPRELRAWVRPLPSPPLPRGLRPECSGEVRAAAGQALAAASRAALCLHLSEPVAHEADRGSVIPEGAAPPAALQGPACGERRGNAWAGEHHPGETCPGRSVAGPTGCRTSAAPAPGDNRPGQETTLPGKGALAVKPSQGVRPACGCHPVTPP